MERGNNNNKDRMLDLRASEQTASKANGKGYTHGLTGIYHPACVPPRMLSDYNEGWQVGQSHLGDQVSFAMGGA